jgi:hypothetical protein
VLIIRDIEEKPGTPGYKRVRDKGFIEGLLCFQEFVKELAGIIEAKSMFEWFCSSVLSTSNY